MTVDTNDCWLFTGQINPWGYGVITIWIGEKNHKKSGRSKNLSAHRTMYENLIGPIPEGLVLDHLCRVPTCINPAHLEPVTDRENLLRGNTIAAKNAAKTHCKKGHEFSGDNVDIRPNGSRACMACRKDWNTNRRVELRALSATKGGDDGQAKQFDDMFKDFGKDGGDD